MWVVLESKDQNYDYVDTFNGISYNTIDKYHNVSSLLHIVAWIYDFFSINLVRLISLCLFTAKLPLMALNYASY